MKVKDEIKLADIAKVLIQHHDEEVNSLKVRELIVSSVDAKGEEESRIPPVDDFVRTKLDKIRELVVARGDQAVHLQRGHVAIQG